MFWLEPYYSNEQKCMRVRLYTRHGVKDIKAPLNPYCFTGGVDGSGLRSCRKHQPVKKVEFDNDEQVKQYRYTHQAYESDVPYWRRLMLDMDMKINDVPKSFIDIEVLATTQPNANRDPIVCIGVVRDDGKEDWFNLYDVIADLEPKYAINFDDSTIEWYSRVPKQLRLQTEFKMIVDFMESMKFVGIGGTWNGGERPSDTRSFDIPYIAMRYAHLKYELHPNREDLDYQKTVVAGIQEFDYLLRHCRFFDLYQIDKFETGRIGKSRKGGYSLENVAQIVLGRGKLKHVKPIYEMTKQEMYYYNINDCRLTAAIDKELHYTDLKIGLAQLTNSLLVSWNMHKKERQDELRPLILVDQLVLKWARSMGLVMEDRANYNEDFEVEGALVIEPKPGLYYGVQNFDINQMYPNIMINRSISPDKDKLLVPTILKTLMKLRKEYKAIYEAKKSAGEEWLADYILQYNYKVLANVFYGAFGNPASRIANVDDANEITGTGREILQRIVDAATDLDYPARYGDTDSGFIQMQKSFDALGYCNARRKVDVLYKVLNRVVAPYTLGKGEFYDAILFVGQNGRGTKKRYIGIDSEGDVTVRGLEIVRRDYCLLARRVQEDVAKLILTRNTWQYISSVYLEPLKERVYKGECDAQLILTKGVKDLSEYNFKKRKDGTEHKGQPHIRAYKKLLSMGYSPRYDISYVLTTEDVEPVTDDRPLPKNIDYDQYWNKQIIAPLKPMVESAFGIKLNEKVKRMVANKPKKHVKKKLITVQELSVQKS